MNPRIKTYPVNPATADLAAIVPVADIRPCFLQRELGGDATIAFDLVRSAGDISLATRLDIPRSTAYGCLSTNEADVVTIEVADMDLPACGIRMWRSSIGRGLCWRDLGSWERTDGG